MSFSDRGCLGDCAMTNWREVVRNLPLRVEFVRGWMRRTDYSILTCPVCGNELTKENFFTASVHRDGCAWIEAQSATLPENVTPPGAQTKT